MNETITLNQLIKRLYNYRAEHADSGRKRVYVEEIYLGKVLIEGAISEEGDLLVLT